MVGDGSVTCLQQQGMQMLEVDVRVLVMLIGTQAGLQL